MAKTNGQKLTSTRTCTSREGKATCQHEHEDTSDLTCEVSTGMSKATTVAQSSTVHKVQENARSQ